MGSLCGKSEKADGSSGGASASKSAAPAAAAAPVVALNIADYTFSKQRSVVLVRTPGAIAGQRFIVEECEDCDIFLCDNMSTITFDECRNCRIFVGPVESSCFLRTCRDCKIIAAVQQWRMRECENCDVLLYSMTEPVVESSTNIRFGCFRFSYQALKEQFAKSGLDPWTNKWSEIYDFTPSSESFSILPTSEETRSDFLKPLPEGVASDGAVVVPITSGKRPSAAGSETALVLIAGDGCDAKAMALSASDGLSIVRSFRFQQADRDTIAKILGDNASQAKALVPAPTQVIALEISGPGCAAKAKEQQGAGFLCLGPDEGATKAVSKIFEAQPQRPMC